MRIEVLWTGEELLDGRVQEGNTRAVAQVCAARGQRLRRVQIVGDDLDTLVDALRETLLRADLLLVGGGLGPTRDDRTREAVAIATGIALVEDADAVARIRARYQQRGRSLQTTTLQQALFPEGARAILNPTGTADGWQQRVGRCTLVVLPGVPSELAAMVDDALRPLLPHQDLPTAAIALYGLGEAETVSTVEEAVTGLDVEVLWCVQSPWVRLLLRGPDAQAPRIREHLETTWGALVLPEGTDDFTQPLLRALKSAGETLALAESCTGGAICSALVDVPGASSVVLQGWCTYANQAKIDALDVPPEALKTHGAVSEAVARAMAEGARAHAQSTWAVATTGIAGPGGGSEARPVGTVWVGIAGPQGTWAAHFVFPGRSRTVFKGLVTHAALWLLGLLRQGAPPSAVRHPHLQILTTPELTR